MDEIKSYKLIRISEKNDFDYEGLNFTQDRLSPRRTEKVRVRPRASHFAASQGPDKSEDRAQSFIYFYGRPFVKAHPPLRLGKFEREIV